MRPVKKVSRTCFSQYKGDLTKDVTSALDTQMKEQLAEDEAKIATKVQSITNDSPISKALSSILEYAAKNKASDIHIEPSETHAQNTCTS